VPPSRSRHWIDPSALVLAGSGVSNSLPSPWWFRSRSSGREIPQGLSAPGARRRKSSNGSFS